MENQLQSSSRLGLPSTTVWSRAKLRAAPTLFRDTRQSQTRMPELTIIPTGELWHFFGGLLQQQTSFSCHGDKNYASLRLKKLKFSARLAGARMTWNDGIVHLSRTTRRRQWRSRAALEEAAMEELLLAAIPFFRQVLYLPGRYQVNITSKY